MDAFAPGLLDRLMDESGQATASGVRHTVEQLKDLVARDIEALLNTRVAMPARMLDEYPHARGSVLNFGLADFAAMCLTSSEDRAAICASIKSAIEAHEPRLTEVSASFEPEAGGVNRLHFVIHAKLRVGADADPVNFNAVLQPSSLRYSITRHPRQRA
ncbi:MAG: type VI secretion system baseplate subunit TssE [Telluria sp.]